MSNRVSLIFRVSNQVGSCNAEFAPFFSLLIKSPILVCNLCNTVWLRQFCVYGVHVCFIGIFVEYIEHMADSINCNHRD